MDDPEVLCGWHTDLSVLTQSLLGLLTQLLKITLQNTLLEDASEPGDEVNDKLGLLIVFRSIALLNNHIHQLLWSVYASIGGQLY
jgi:hypothetical protein